MPVPQVDLAAAGPRFSRLVLGLWRVAGWGLSDAELLALVHVSLDLGITTCDHADIYGDYSAEEIFGHALALEPSLRQRMQLVTKGGIKLVSARRPDHGLKHYDTSRAHIIASAENSLRLLGTDYLDLLLIHRPDPLLDPDEVAGAFVALRQAGKVLHFGVSNFAPSQFELLASRLDLPLVTNQVEISLLNMGALYDGTVDQCQRLGIAPMAWSPLAGGRLLQGGGEPAVRLRRTLQGVGEELGGALPEQVALAWILRHPGRIVPIVGSGRIERVRNLAAATDLHLSREQWFRLWAASTGREVH